MLQSIREHTQGWIAGIIVSILILSFSLWGIHSYFGATATDAVATVNGVEVSKRDLQQAYNRLAQQLQAQGGTLADIKDSAIRTRALQGLITLQVMRQASVAENFNISTDQMNGYLLSIPEFQVNGQFSPDRFYRLMHDTLFTPSEFMNLVKTSLLIEQPRLGMVFSSFALPHEVKTTVAMVNQERDIRYLLIDEPYFLKSGITISESAVKAYYATNTHEFKTKDKVSVDYILLSVADIMRNQHPTDSEVHNFYSDNIANYTKPALWRLESIYIPYPENASSQEISKAEQQAKSVLDRIHKGENFTTLAKSYPDDTYLKNTQWWALDQLPLELQKPVSVLDKPNTVSSLIETNEGIVIVRVDEYQPTRIQAFSDVKVKVMEAYTHQLASEKFAEIRDKLDSLTFEHADSLQPAASALQLPIRSTGLFTTEKGNDEIANYKKVRETAFSDDVLTQQNNSSVISINPETVLVLRLKSHVPPTEISYDSVQKQISDKLKRAAALEKAKTLAESLVMQLNQKNAVFTTLATKNGLAWHEVGAINRYATHMDPAIMDLAFRLPQVNTQHGVQYGLIRLPDGYAVVGLKSVHDGVLKDAEKQRLFSEQVGSSLGLLEYELYKQSLIQQAKIKQEQPLDPSQSIDM